jgi:hypothetical protein
LIALAQVNETLVGRPRVSAVSDHDWPPGLRTNAPFAEGPGALTPPTIQPEALMPNP